jgi:Outer membrane protein beta-barrel domain
MRKVSTLVGLTLFALASTSRAQAAPAAPTAAEPPAGDTVTSPAPSADENAPPPGTATAASAPAQYESSPRKIQVGLAFLPMGMGRYTFSDTYTTTASSDAYFAYGLSLTVGYEVLPGLVVGVAPQVIFNVQPKPMEAANPAVAREYDLMARVAYVVRVASSVAFYAEVLPGFSRISPSDQASPASGLVLGFGAGCTMDLTDRFFVNVGGGYQIGFQSQTEGIHQMELRTKYARVTMGGGVKF